jgi:hypothetical protein
MTATVMIIACTALLGALAVGFLICCVLMIVGIIYQRNDRYMVIMYGTMLLISAGLCAGLVIAAIAVGRNLL